MAQNGDTHLREKERLNFLKLEAKQERIAAIEQMTRQFEDDMQPDGIPYTVLANSLTDHDNFIQGLRNAGFELHDEHISIVPSCPETAIVTFASGVHARQAMLALHLRDFKGMEGKKMCLMKASPQSVGIWDNRSPCAPLPTYPVILQAMGEAYHAKAVAPRRAEKAAARLATGLRKIEKRMMRLEEARLAQEARLAKKAANIEKAQEAVQKAKLAKEERRARHSKRMEEQKLRKEAKMKEARISTQRDEDPSDRVAGMEHIEAVAEKRPKISALLEAMRPQHRNKEHLGTALQGRMVHDAQLAGLGGSRWDTAVIGVAGAGAGESMDGIVRQKLDL